MQNKRYRLILILANVVRMLSDHDVCGYCMTTKNKAISDSGETFLVYTKFLINIFFLTLLHFFILSHKGILSISPFFDSYSSSIHKIFKIFAVALTHTHDVCNFSSHR